jgi:hypothetical protein
MSLTRRLLRLLPAVRAARARWLRHDEFGPVFGCPAGVELSEVVIAWLLREDAANDYDVIAAAMDVSPQKLQALLQEGDRLCGEVPSFDRICDLLNHGGEVRRYLERAAALCIGDHDLDRDTAAELEALQTHSLLSESRARG